MVACAVVWSCADQQPVETNTSTETKDEVKAPQPSKKKKGKSVELPFLTSENCAEHLKKYGEQNPENRVEMETPFGVIKLKLYDDTPIHRANFVMLAKRLYFDQTVFYRVIDTFMIQGGNSDSWDTQYLKAEIGNYRLPAEIKSKYYHKRGALCAARNYTDNPEKVSSPFVFYIVQRGPITEEGMRWMEVEENKSYTPEIREHYKKYGGTPGLDGEHTIFGEVVSGMDVVDKITKVETDGKDWPKEDVWIKVKVN